MCGICAVRRGIILRKNALSILQLHEIPSNIFDKFFMELDPRTARPQCHLDNNIIVIIIILEEIEYGYNDVDKYNY